MSFGGRVNATIKKRDGSDFFVDFGNGITTVIPVNHPLWIICDYRSERALVIDLLAREEDLRSRVLVLTERRVQQLVRAGILKHARSDDDGRELRCAS